MSPGATRAFFSFFVPGGIVFLGAVILIRAGMWAEWAPVVTRVYPYIVLAVGVLLGWRFNRSRLIFALLILALADRALLHFAYDHSAGGKIAYNAVAVLLPLNLALFALVKERGIVTMRGLARAALILAQPLIVALLYRYQRADLSAYLKHEFLAAAFLDRAPLSQPALLAFGIAFLVLLIAFVRHKGAIEGGFLWALVLALLALVSGEPGALSTFYFASAGLVLVIAVVETSYSMAFRDELTGLPARRALNEALLKLGNRYTVAMIDIDFFKKFNDRYGHDVGDQVLRMVAGKLSAVTGGGKAFRYGGEEFTVLFPGKAVEEAVPHLEQLRESVEESSFIIRGRGRPKAKPKSPKKGSGKKVSITISIGAAERDERQANPQDVIKAADKALYRAKNAGRNRVAA